MKKLPVVLILIMITSFIAFPPAVKTADADGDAEIVLRVVEDNVYFYSDFDFKEENRLFLLTKTYFLSGIDHGDYYAVQYKKNSNAEINGFVKKSDVEIYEDGVPSLLYPAFQTNTQRTFITLFYDINTMESFNGYAESLKSCYGKITKNSKTYLLVYYEGQPPRRGIYYVSYEDLEITEPSAHPIPLRVIPENPDDGNNPNDDNPGKSNNNETVQIIIIVAVIVFAVAVVYFMFRPNTRKYKKNDES